MHLLPALLLVALAYGQGAPAEPPVSTTAQLLHAAGQVLLRTGTGPQRPIEVGTPLPEGVTVCTAPDAWATIRLARDLTTPGHDDVSLFGGTCLTLVTLRAGATSHASRITMEQGSVSVRAVDTPGSLAIQTRDGVTAGTTGGFRVTVEPEATRTEAVERPVSVRGAGQEVAVGAGQGTRVREGRAPEAPVDLPQAALLDRPDEGGVLRRPDFVWHPVDGALGYRVEISATEAFDAILVAEEVPAAAWRPDVLFLPYRVPGLYWRVAAFDRVGFLGLPSQPRSLAFPAGVGP